MATIKGKQLMVRTTVPIGTGNRDFRTIAYATNHTLEIGSNLDDVATKDDNELFVNQEITSQNWSLTTENLIAADIDDEGAPTFQHLLDVMKQQTQIEVQFASLPGAMGAERQGTNWSDSGNTPQASIIMSGYAYITSLELNAGNRENVSYTATFTGVGKPTIYNVTNLNSEATNEAATASVKKSKKSEVTETVETAES